MTEFIVASDIDIPLVRTDLHWMAWLENVCQTKLDVSPGTRLSYDLTTYFKEELTYQGLTGMEFWKQDNLYDKLPPVEGSVDALESLWKQGATILCLSAHMGLHAASKRDWVYRHYPFVKDVILLDKGVNKCYVKCDVIIEDHVENLVGFGLETMKVVVDSPYLSQDYDGLVYTDWKDIVKHISWYKETWRTCNEYY